MPSVQHVALFKYQDFVEDAYQLRRHAQKENFKLLRQRTKSAINYLRKEWPSVIDDGYLDRNGEPRQVQDWPLYHHGDGPLITEKDVDNVLTPSSGEIAYWFRVVLAENLQPYPHSPLGNWSVLNSALALLGWKDNDREMLFLGLPTYILIKPDIIVKQPWPPTERSPYWLQIHPYGARSGWLPTEKIEEFSTRLKNIKNKIDGFDVHRIPNINIDNPVVIRTYTEYLKFAFRDTIAMYSTAIENGLGLFMSITLPMSI